MASELDFFAKADQASNIYIEAAKRGRKVGRPPIFYKHDAPAYLRNQLTQLPTEAEWQARLDREAADPIIQKFGAGATILSLYYDPVRKAHAVAGDPDSPLMEMATPDDLKRLWDQYFRMYPVREERPRYTAKFQAALDAEEARRKAA